MDKNQCDICTKEFTEKYNLDQHKRQIHQDYKPYECENCGKRFIRKKYRNYYLRICPISSGGGVTKEFNQYVKDLQFTPVLRSSAFERAITWWEIKFPDQSYYIKPDLLLKESLHAMKKTIQ